MIGQEEMKRILDNGSIGIGLSMDCMVLAAHYRARLIHCEQSDLHNDYDRQVVELLDKLQALITHNNQTLDFVGAMEKMEAEK